MRANCTTNAPQLDKLAAAISARGIPTDTLLVQGPAAETILQQADALDAKLIVLGSHGHGMLYHALVGSTSAAVIKGSHRPVLVIPDANRQTAQAKTSGP